MDDASNNLGRLCISREVGQRLVIDPGGPQEVIIEVVSLMGRVVRLRVIADRRLPIARGELAAVWDMERWRTER